MSREWVIAGIVALLFHGLLLFGLHLETVAVPLPTADTTVEVSLVDGAAAAAPAAVEPPVEPPPTEAAPVPPPPVEPTPPVALVEPSHEAPVAPVPPVRPVHHEAVRPAHPSVAPRAVGAPQAAHSEGPAMGAVGASGTGKSGVRARYNPRPAYPPEAERMHQEGRVGLAVQVGADGRVISVTVTHSSGVAILDAAAVEGVKRWTFEPARVGGVAVAGRADVPVVFSLQDRGR